MKWHALALGCAALVACASDTDDSDGASALAPDSGVESPDAADSGGSGNGVTVVEAPKPEDTPSAEDSLPSPTPLEVGAELRTQFASLETTLRAHVDSPEWFADGYWQDHFGDAFLYGPAVDARQFAIEGDEDALERCLIAIERNRELVVEATGDIALLSNNVESVAMAMLGLFEVSNQLQEPQYRDEAEALLGLADTLSMGADDYLDLPLGDFASSNYGPSSLTTFIALAHLERALAYPEAAEESIARADAVLQSIHDKAWDPEQSIYRFAPDNPDLYLYPNALLMLSYGRAWELTGSEVYAERLLAIYQGIQPLRAPAGDYFFSPYSAEVMGAQTDDYATLSATNYLMLGLWLAYRATEEPALAADLSALLGFCETRLLEDGRLLHHWMDGDIAQPDHLSYYCTGCNLQTLFVFSLLTDF